VNDPTVFRRDCFKPNCATTLFNQRDSARAITYSAITKPATLCRYCARQAKNNSDLVVPAGIKPVLFAERADC
jgi:hypothetical protein